MDQKPISPEEWNKLSPVERKGKLFAPLLRNLLAMTLLDARSEVVGMEVWASMLDDLEKSMPQWKDELEALRDEDPDVVYGAAVATLVQMLDEVDLYPFLINPSKSMDPLAAMPTSGSVN